MDVHGPSWERNINLNLFKFRGIFSKYRKGRGILVPLYRCHARPWKEESCCSRPTEPTSVLAEVNPNALTFQLYFIISLQYSSFRHPTMYNPFHLYIRPEGLFQMRRSNIIRMVNDKHRCPYENIFPILICVFIFSLEYFFLWKWWNIHVYFFNTISESLNKLLCFLLIRVVLAGKHMLSFMNSLYLSSSLPVSRQTNAPPLHPL